MKYAKVVIVAGLMIVAGLAQNASADVTAIKARFGGGCSKANTDSTCTIKATFSGTDLSSETAFIKTSATRAGSFTKVSRRSQAVSETGFVLFKIRNNPGGCYEVITGPNGNDKPDVTSNKVCEQ